LKPFRGRRQLIAKPAVILADHEPKIREGFTDREVVV
jgi:hypothetical protein